MRISDWSSDVCSSDLLVAVVLVMGQLHPVGTGAHAFGSRHPLGPMPLAVTIGQGIERCGIADTLAAGVLDADHARSEEHTSELQSLMRISYAVFCLKKKHHTHESLPPTSSPY